MLVENCSLEINYPCLGVCAVNPALGTIMSQTEIICSGSLLGFGLGLNVVFPGFIMGKKSPEMLDHNTAVLSSMGKLT